MAFLGRRRPKETWCCVRLPRCGFGFFPWTLRLDTRPYAEGGLVRRGRRTPLLFGPEGMRRSKVHAAGVLRMKQAAYYHTAN